ncbi:hypothetical protein [Niveibacterium umoris]|nr:hypothetical protein [Niveibacterium umoris]
MLDIACLWSGEPNGSTDFPTLGKLKTPQVELIGIAARFPMRA